MIPSSQHHESISSCQPKILIIRTINLVVFEEASGNEDGCICVIVVKHQVAQAISRDLRSPSQQSVCIAITADASTVAKRPVPCQPAPTPALFHDASSGTRLSCTTLSGATHTTWVSLLPSPKDAAMTHGTGCWTNKSYHAKLLALPSEWVGLLPVPMTAIVSYCSGTATPGGAGTVQI
jgi:hypothetical protein